MNWRAYLRPNVAKLVIGAILLGLLSGIPTTFCVEGGTTFGFPFVFYSRCNGPDSEGALVPGEVRFNTIALATDMMLWYLVAASLVTLLGMGRERRGHGEKPSSGEESNR